MRRRLSGSRSQPVSRIVFTLVVGVSMIVSACGIPVNDEVEFLAQDDHLELLNGTTSTTAAVAEPDDPESFPTELFFVQDNKLEKVTRAFLTAPTGNDLLVALEAGPNQDEIDAFAEGPDDLQTLLPAGLGATFGELDRETGAQQILVNPEALLRQLVEEQPEGARLIVSQIVCTVLTLGFDSVAGVEIFDGDERIPLSDNAAELIDGPAQIENFDNCITGTELRQEQLDAENQNSTTTEG